MNETIARRYQLAEPLGGGGTSLVYRAEMIDGGPDVALKLLRPQFAADPALRRRFLREAELARGLEHAGIVRVLDAGEDEGRPFLALEMVRAETLRQRLDREGRLDLAPARAIFLALAAALDHAHGRGVIHRDVKPQNIFVGGAVVKLGDFGNARVVSLASVTGASLTWGTPEYVAPELFSRGRADPRSDLYALGVVFYEMLTGRLPWSRAGSLTRLGAPAGSAPNFEPTGAGDQIDRLIGDLLARSPSDRPASGEEISARLAESGAFAVTPTNPCSACGAPRPADIPRCLSCGLEILRLRHDRNGRWRLVLNKLEDDAAATENLLRLVDPLVKRVGRPLLFLTGDGALYSETEVKTGVSLPAVLFSQLDEGAARELAALCRAHGLDVEIRRGTAQMLPAKGTRPVKVTRLIPLAAVMMGAMAAGQFRNNLIGVVAIAGLMGTLLGVGAIGRRWRARRTAGVFKLREQLAAIPVADGLLTGAVGAVAQIKAPEVRALVSDVASELYRLTRRVAAMDARPGAASSEADLIRRTVAAAPTLIERLKRIAARLDALDTALEGASEGELMQTLGRLERAAGAPGADTRALTLARGDVDRTLERRHATEQERAQLAARLCQLLGRLRQEYRRVRAMETPDEQEARAVESASAELEAFLAAGS